MGFCGENQLTMVIQRGSDQLFGELITLKDQILMPIISHRHQCSLYHRPCQHHRCVVFYKTPLDAIM